MMLRQVYYAFSIVYGTFSLTSFGLTGNSAEIGRVWHESFVHTSSRWVKEARVPYPMLGQLGVGAEFLAGSGFNKCHR